MTPFYAFFESLLTTRDGSGQFRGFSSTDLSLVLRRAMLIRSLTFLGFVLFAILLSSGTVQAQQPTEAVRDTAPSDPQAMHEDDPLVRQGSGTVTLTDWPSSLGQLIDEMGRNAPYLLPKIDSLALDYRYAAGDSTSQWSFVLGWRPGRRVLHKGDVLSRQSAPSNLEMVNVELRARITVEGEYVGDMIVAVDSMALSPFPSIYSFEVTVGHDRVFLDQTAEQARQALDRGVVLDSLVVERMGFVSADPSSSTGPSGPDVHERRRDTHSEPSIYESRSRVFIGWRMAPRPYYVGQRNGNRTVRPRRASVGRGATNRDARVDAASRDDGSDGDGDSKTSRSGSTSNTDEEDDDEDKTSLRGPALGAAAAVGLVAYAGGTVGLYGRGDTPIGLAAGYTRPGGGIQLYAAVNRAVLEGTAGQKLTVKTLGFYDLFSSLLQPAVGIGLQIDPQRNGRVRPSASVGLSLNAGRVVVVGGVDVVQKTPEIGVTYNFRHQSRHRGAANESGEK